MSAEPSRTNAEADDDEVVLQIGRGALHCQHIVHEDRRIHTIRTHLRLEKQTLLLLRKLAQRCERRYIDRRRIGSVHVVGDGVDGREVQGRSVFSDELKTGHFRGGNQWRRSEAVELRDDGLQGLCEPGYSTSTSLPLTETVAVPSVGRKKQASFGSDSGGTQLGLFWMPM